MLAVADAPTRVGLRGVLRSHGFDVVAEVEEAAAAVEAVKRAGPDLAVLASELPGGAVDAMAEISRRRPGVRLVMLTTSPDDEELLAAVLAGASGYLSAMISPARLPDALRGVLAGEVALPRRLSARLLDELRARRTHRAIVSAHATSPISAREWEILELLDEGCSTAEMARRLRISEVTVRRHASSAAAKLGVADRAEAVALLRERSVD
jgi:DNA-binding NarL/FixJ family response regulator